MLVQFSELLAAAASDRRAVGGFTAYNLETAAAVVEAAARQELGVMLLISEQAFSSRIGSALASTLLAVAERAHVPCCVQLDHVASLEKIKTAFEAGIGAVMADGSKLSYAENVELVTGAARLAAHFGAGVEAELGRIEGDEEIATAAPKGKLTDPDQAERFVVETGASCLAVSIGNAHGRYARPPEIDLERLERIDAATAVPLSLHGASGLDDEDVIATIQRGIRKVNINTELRDCYFDLNAERLPELRTGARLLALQEELVAALAEVVKAKLTLFAGKPATDAPLEP